MEILVKRNIRGENATYGTMYINGKKFADTLEDTDRMLHSSDHISVTKGLKVPGETCIPSGRYFVDAYYWSKYRRVYPLLRDVPAFTGILIHSGVNEEDTRGCILVGHRVEDKLFDGFTYMAALRKLCIQAWNRHEEITITIIRDYDND